MPAARQPAAALRDRAERHVFSVLPELGAMERRTLAMVELCGLDHDAAARDLGIDEAAVHQALAAARKALRRTRGELASGSRCERAELLLCGEHLDRHARKWLEIHMARCSRCIAHEELLDAARSELRETFEAEPAALPPAPEPPTPEEGRARLRVVPPAPPGPANLNVQHVPVAQDVFTPVETHPVVRPSPAARKAARVIAILLVVMGILAGIGIGLDALRGPDHATAPWTKPNAPVVQPPPLSGQ